MTYGFNCRIKNSSGTSTNQHGIDPTDVPSNSPNVLPNVSSSSKPSASMSPASDKVVVPNVDKVKAAKVAAGKKKLILKWKKSSGMSGYQI